MTRKRMCSRFLASSLAVSVLVFYSSSHLRAEENTTAFISGTVSNNSGANFCVGNTGRNNHLEINHAGKLINVNQGGIGLKPGANNNTAIVTGSGSSWNNTGRLTIGVYGSTNTLTIDNGGMVSAKISCIGDMISACSNAVIVTGSSVWSMGGVLPNKNFDLANTILPVDDSASMHFSLAVGNSGYSNSLSIADGGKVIADLCIGFDSTAYNNTVTVSDLKSQLQGDICVGYFGSGNTLTIANSGTVQGSKGCIGFYSNACNNVVTVTDTDSRWKIGNDVTVGRHGSFNTLIVTNNSKVAGCLGCPLPSIFIGLYSNACNNAVTVIDGGIVDSKINYVGYSGSYNALIISSGGSVGSEVGHIGFKSNANKNSVTVNHSGWHMTESLCVGSSGSYNALTVANGGVMSDITGCIGSETNANNNLVVVNDPGSVWNNSKGLTVGDSGSDNSLIVSNRGQVTVLANMYVGVSGTNNLLYVTDGYLTVAATLEIRNGALTFDGGTITVGHFQADNSTNSVVMFNSGFLSAIAATVGNGTNFGIAQ